jgi:hypothetical protein
MEKNGYLFEKETAEIAKISDHNIDSWSQSYNP